MKIKPVTMWAVASEKAGIANWSIQRTRQESIAAFLQNDDRGWAHYSRRGWRCIKVVVTPESEVKP